MVTKEVVSSLAKSESEQTGEGPVQGGATATAQSLLHKQESLAAKVREIQDKPAEDISLKDAAELQSKQDRVLGTGARTPSSLAAEVQRQADHNETKTTKHRSQE